MPDFTIAGDPGAIRAQAQVTSSKAQLFHDTGAGLSKIEAAGWTGRAADRFRDAHDLEPDRWYQAGNGFARAGAALTTYAERLESAQEVAAWAQREYARGEQVTASARSAYDADLADGRAKLAAGIYSSLQVLPFDDPGAAIRSQALAALAAARSALDNAAHVCAGEVRAGCADAPEEPGWLESGLRFVGGVLEGTGEALWDLATMMPFSPINLVDDTWKLATGDLTPEELLTRYELGLDQAHAMLGALRDDPVEFGKVLGKGLLDWDTWADDPARALGHLVPDAIAAAFTASAAGAATRGAGAVDDVADGLRALDRMGDASELRRLVDLDAFDDLRRFDDVPEAPQGTWRDLGDPGLDAWVDEVHELHPELSRDGIRGLWDYTTDGGYDALNGQLRSGATDPAVQARIDATNDGIAALPTRPGDTFRGTNLPDHVLDEIQLTGRYSDPAFSSSSMRPDVAEGFIRPHDPNPTRITIEGVSGVDVRPFSAARGEAEILFPSQTEFEVVSNVMGTDGVRTLVLREAP